MKNLHEILEAAVKEGASDIFLVPGLPLTLKIKGQQKRYDEEGKYFPDSVKSVVEEIYRISEREPRYLHEMQDDDFSIALSNLGRFRVNVFHQRGSLAVVIRVVKFGIPDPKEMQIPDFVLNLADQKNGLVLVTGAAGSGKSTTLACMIDRINRSREGHIITLEDPIEFVYRHDRSIVSQREISVDTADYLSSLKSALRESPDVILLGEMRDYETISAAITAAETGVLLFSSLHTMSASNTINRILDVYPANAKQQVKIQLAQLLRGIVCQQLVQGVNGEQIPVFEVLRMTPAVQNKIRNDKLHLLGDDMHSNDDMCTMDESLLKLLREGRITKETALASCNHYEVMKQKLESF